MSKKIKEVVLAQDFDEDSYQQQPIESFGLGLLQSMGFTKERGIGKNQKTALKDIVVNKPRPRGQGLGAQQKQQEKKEQFEPGMYVLITKKEHQGLTGIIIEVKQEVLQVELLKSQSQVQVKKKHTKIISKQEQTTIDKPNEEEQTKKKKKLKWILPGLRIKIVDKNSKFYLKKVVVVDMLDEREFECLYEGEQGKTIIRNLREKDVQTIVPKVGQNVLILSGQYKGQKGQVFHRDKKNQKLTVQTLIDFQMVTLSQDHACEYVDI